MVELSQKTNKFFIVEVLNRYLCYNIVKKSENKIDWLRYFIETDMHDYFVTKFEYPLQGLKNNSQYISWRLILIIEFLQIAQDLLSNCQSTVFVEMINDIVEQVKQNPHQIPIPTTYRRNIEKVLEFTTNLRFVFMHRILISKEKKRYKIIFQLVIWLTCSIVSRLQFIYSLLNASKELIEYRNNLSVYVLNIILAQVNGERMFLNCYQWRNVGKVQ